MPLRFSDLIPKLYCNLRNIENLELNWSSWWCWMDKFTSVLP